MDTKELLKKVRKIEIKTKGLTNNIFAGEYHSAFKGRGMAFSEVREYQFGDDIRNIDWNVTARFGHPYVKVFEEEREMTVILLIDVSPSIKTGSTRLKSELVAELTAVLAFSATQNNDKIGVIFFGEKIEKFIPPQKGKSHILRIIREIVNFGQINDNVEKKNNFSFKNILLKLINIFSKKEDVPKVQTNISEALKFLTNAITKKSTVFIISDFQSPDFSKALRIANQKHDVIALYTYDQIEKELPVGYNLRLKDSENYKIMDINTNNSKIKATYTLNWNNKNEEHIDVFIKSGVDFVLLPTDKDFVKPLINLFKKR